MGIIQIYQGVSNKLEQLKHLIEQWNCTGREIAYIGDDLNDYPCMEFIKQQGGCVGCPVDAANAVAAIADFMSTKEGGNGAVREFIELLTAMPNNN